MFLDTLILCWILTQFIVSAIFIVFAGISLTKFADTIAQQTGLGRLVVGSFLLASATSLPELLVDLNAIKAGMPNLAIGDLVGSCLYNLLILAIADLIHQGPARMFSRASAIHALSGCMSISVIAIAGASIIFEKGFDFQIGPLSLGTISILVAYALGFRMILIDQNNKHILDGGNPSPKDKDRNALFRAVGGFIVSAGILVLASPFLSQAAGRLADEAGLGRTFVGTTLVALCTSLPELVATLSSLKLGAYDMAIGNIFGSNAFNMLLLVPLDIAHQGSLLSAVSNVHSLTCFAAILATSIAVMGQLYQVENRKRFIEPDAFAIIAIVALTLVAIFII